MLPWCCHGVVAQHYRCEVPREAGGIPCLRRWQISFLPQDPGSCQGSHQTCNQHCQKWAGEYSSAQNQSQGKTKQTQPGAFRESTTVQDHGTVGEYSPASGRVVQGTRAPVLCPNRLMGVSGARAPAGHRYQALCWIIRQPENLSTQDCKNTWAIKRLRAGARNATADR